MAGSEPPFPDDLRYPDEVPPRLRSSRHWRWKAFLAAVVPLVFVLMVGGVAYANTFMLHSGSS